jgi:hypothetical protein
VFFWQSLMAATLIPAIPLALLYNAFLDRFIKGFTGGPSARQSSPERRSTRGRRSRRSRSASSALTRGDLLKRGSAAAFAVSMFGGLAGRAFAAPYGPLKFAHRQLSGELRIMTWAQLRSRLRQVARRDVREAVGGGQRRRGQDRPHQQRAALLDRRRRGRCAERPRPLLVHLAPGVVPEAGNSGHRPGAGGEQEGRPDDAGGQKGDVQPEDEAVLRLPRDVRARPGPVPAQPAPADGREPEHVGRSCARGRRS